MNAVRLEVTDGRGSRTVVIDRDLFTIGRRGGHSLQLTGSDISRDHAVIERTGTQFTIKAVLKSSPICSTPRCRARIRARSRSGSARCCVCR